MTLTLEISFTDRFWPSVYGLAASETKQVMKAVTQLASDPLNDSLRLKPTQGDPTGRKYTCRASREVRLLGFKQGSVLLLERAGHHDAIYELARRVDVILNEGAGRIVVVNRELAAAATPTAPAEPQAVAAVDGPRSFDHWGDADLREAGFDDKEIDAIRGCVADDDLFSLPIDEEAQILLIVLLAQTPEQWRTPPIDAEAAAAERFRRAIVDHGALAGISPLFSPDEVTKPVAAPIEEWMVFLYPDQRAAERRFEGPARAASPPALGRPSWRSRGTKQDRLSRIERRRREASGP